MPTCNDSEVPTPNSVHGMALRMHHLTLEKTNPLCSACALFYIGHIPRPSIQTSVAKWAAACPPWAGPSKLHAHALHGVLDVHAPSYMSYYPSLTI